MTDSPDVVPIMLDLDLDDMNVAEDLEDLIEETEEVEKTSLLSKLLKPVFLIGAASAVVIIGASFFMVSSGTLERFGAPKLDNQIDSDAEKIALKKQEAEPLEKEDEGEAEKKDLVQDYGKQGSSKGPLSSRFGGIEKIENGGAYYHTAPASVSIRSSVQGRTLTLSLGILTDEASAETLWANGDKINLLLIEAVNAIDFGPYDDWAIPGLICAELEKRIKETYPETVVKAVLIRDFQMS